ncbi:MAG: DUF4384 domain-containing protein [Gemmatimonadota bacterium]|nr:DUF4384 domain-containing protein [Gemmatimonadota bacterium]
MNLTTAAASRLLASSVLLCTAAPVLLEAQRAPNVAVWFDRGNEFDRGDAGRIMYSGEAGSYLTLVRVNTDGRMAILYPSRPNDRSRYHGDRNGSALAFQADPTEGVGYVFAVASRTPFDFRGYRGRGDSWDTGTLDRRAATDPFEIVDRFARSSVGARGEYSIAYAPYEIGRGGAGRSAYRGGVRYDDGYGGYAGGYSDPWGASPYRQGYNDFRYYGTGDGRGYRNGYGYDTPYSSDPRTRALRHCPDGTLAPYTTPCAAFTRPSHGSGRPVAQPRGSYRP